MFGWDSGSLGTVLMLLSKNEGSTRTVPLLLILTYVLVELSLGQPPEGRNDLHSLP
jgi:hypothetical protein